MTSYGGDCGKYNFLNKTIQKIHISMKVCRFLCFVVFYNSEYKKRVTCYLNNKTKKKCFMRKDQMEFCARKYKDNIIIGNIPLSEGTLKY